MLLYENYTSIKLIFKTRTLRQRLTQKSQGFQVQNIQAEKIKSISFRMQIACVKSIQKPQKSDGLKYKG